MAMLRYGTAAIAEPCVSPDAWEKKVVASCPDGVCRMKVARSVIAKYSPEKYLLSHVSIMAAVDTDLANPSDPKSNYLIKPEFAKFVNNNGDAWTKAMLAASYRTFIGANNFLEHVQIPSLSKGKVVDAVLREVPIGKDKQGKDLTTYYVDLLVATDRKHRELVADIESSKLTTLSMGCKIIFSKCTKCGNKAYDDTQLCQCVKYEKGNNFIDKMGVTRKVAELCGDASEPESVIFIDASWVRNPAFTGAVRRNTVAPTADIMAKIEAAHKKKAYEVKEGDLLRAASIRFGLAKTSAEEDPYAEPPPPDAPAEEPPAEEPPADVLPADAPPTDAPADAPPADAPPEEAPPAEPMPPAEPANPIKDWKNKVKEKLLEELGNEIMNEFSGTEEGPTGPRPLETLDESLIQPAASTTIKRTIVNARQWDNYLTKTYSHMDKKALDKIRFGTYMVMSTRDPYVLKDYGYNGRDFLAVLSVLDSCFPNAMSNQVKKAMARVSSVDQVKVKIGRDLTDGERKKVAAWLKAVEKYQN